MLPIKNFSSLLVLLTAFDTPVFRLHETIPFSPMRILDFDVTLFVGVSLLETNEFVQISQHVDENSAFSFPLEEICQGELNSIFRFEEINHLADYVFEVKIKIALHIC
jgi:hypothetical protein